MNLLVFGATGPLGRCVVDTALSAGHTVTAFVRTPGRLSDRSGLSEATGDVLDGSAVRSAVPGHDAVISALGHSSPSPNGKDLHTGTSHIIDAMNATEVRRLIWITSHGVGDSRGYSGFVFEHIIVPLSLRSEFADKERQEALVTNSGLDWTIVRPARLTNGPASGRLLAEPRLRVSIRDSVSRSDVARFVIAEVEQRQYVLAAPTVVAKR